jgi:hypothetical protein
MHYIVFTFPVTSVAQTLISTMASDHLERLWQSIIPLSQIPKARKEPTIDAPNASLPPLAAVDPIGTTSRIQQDVALKSIDKLTERINALLEVVTDAKCQVLMTNGKMTGVMDQALEKTTALGRPLTFLMQQE